MLLWNYFFSDLEDSDAFDTDLEDGEEESDSDSEEENKAPSQLLMEVMLMIHFVLPIDKAEETF